MKRAHPESGTFRGRGAQMLLALEANWIDPADDARNMRWVRSWTLNGTSVSKSTMRKILSWSSLGSRSTVRTRRSTSSDTGISISSIVEAIATAISSRRRVDDLSTSRHIKRNCTK